MLRHWSSQPIQRAMTGRLVTIFGGAGFVGRHLAPRLAANGWAVRIASRHPEPQQPGRSGTPMVSLTADLRDDDQVGRAVHGAEAAINLVGIGRERGQSFEAVHVEGAARVARLAAAAGIGRLLHLSALGIAEDAPSAADRSKAGGETAVRAAFPAATIVRPSLIYGPGDHFFSRFAAMARLSPVLPIIGGGRTRFQPIHLEDATRTLALLLERPGTAGATLALVAPETFTFRELLERMLAVLGRRRLVRSVPFPVAEALAASFELLPKPPLTREEIRLLKTDKVAEGLPTPASLGLTARPLHEGLPAALGMAR
jgi:NADH dehydrogenase